MDYKTQFHEFLLNGGSENMLILVRKVMVILVISGGIRVSDLQPLKQSSLCKIQNGYQCTSKDIVFNILNKKNESGVSRGEIVDDYLKKLKANLPHLNDNSPLFLCGKSSFFSKFSYWHWNYSRNTSLDFRISQAEGQL